MDTFVETTILWMSRHEIMVHTDESFTKVFRAYGYADEIPQKIQGKKSQNPLFVYLKDEWVQKRHKKLLSLVRGEVKRQESWEKG